MEWPDNVVPVLDEPLFKVADRRRVGFALSRLAFGPHTPTPIGIFRDVDRPLYEAEVQEQVEEAIAQQGPGDLAELIRSGPTWTVT